MKAKYVTINGKQYRHIECNDHTPVIQVKATVARGCMDWKRVPTNAIHVRAEVLRLTANLAATWY